MSKRIIIILLVVVAFGIGGAAIVYFGVINKPHRNIERASIDYSITAEVLFAELTEDQQMANEKYLKDNVLELSGTVMEKISLGDSVFILNIGTAIQSDNIINVQLHGKYVTEPAYQAKYSQLKRGDPVVIKGKYTGSDLEDLIILQAYKVSLNNGFIIDKES